MELIVGSVLVMYYPLPTLKLSKLNKGQAIYRKNLCGPENV